MSSHSYLGDAESLKDLESRMVSPDREIYADFKHLRVESAFLGRIYVVYKPTGLTSSNIHRDPEILGQLKVIGFVSDGQRGSTIELENLSTGEVLSVSHIPRRIFDFDAYVASPPFQRLRWDGRVMSGTVKRSLAFGILLKTRTRSDYYSAGATMVESPKAFRELYPNVKLSLQFI
jgi:hypothetical protein